MLDKHLIAKTEPAALQENMVEREGVRITVLGDRLFRIEQEPRGIFVIRRRRRCGFGGSNKYLFLFQKIRRHRN